MSDYFSEETCACGCENLLPQKLVDRGIRNLYGHKGGGVRKQSGPRKVTARPEPAKTLGTREALVFLRAELDSLKRQAEDAREQRDSSQARLELLSDRVQRTHSAIQALEALDTALERKTEAA